MRPTNLLAAPIASLLAAALAPQRPRGEEPAAAGVDGLARTALRGGPGGEDFEVLYREQRPVVGLVVTTGHLGVDSVVHSMWPVFRTAEGVEVVGEIPVFL